MQRLVKFVIDDYDLSASLSTVAFYDKIRLHKLKNAVINSF